MKQYMYIKADTDAQVDFIIVEAENEQDAFTKLNLSVANIRAMGIGLTDEQWDDPKYKLDEGNVLSISGIEKHLIEIDSDSPITINYLTRV